MVKSILWDFKISSDVTVDFEVGLLDVGYTSSTSFSTNLECELDRLLGNKDSKANCNLQSLGNANIGKFNAGEGTARDGNDETTIEHIKLSRRIETSLPRYEVNDNPNTAQPNNSFLIDVQISVPVVIEVKMNPILRALLPGLANPAPQKLNTSMPIKLTIEYNPHEKTHSEQNQDISAEINSYLQDNYIKNIPAIAKATVTKGTADYSLTKRNLSLKYGEAGFDVAVLQYPDHIAIDKHVCFNQSSWMVHSNMTGQVQINEKDQITFNLNPNTAYAGKRVSSDFEIWRLCRSVDTDAKGNPVHNLEKIPSIPDTDVLGRGWIFDCRQPIEDWLDNAALSSVLKEPSTWSRRGVINEFLVGVNKYPEFGLLYVAVIIDIKKNAYRIAYSNPRPITIQQAEEIYHSNTPLFASPFKSEADGWIS